MPATTLHRHTVTHMALLSGSLAAAFLWQVAPARACSPFPCTGGHTTPREGATVPATLDALRWIPRHDGGDGVPDESSVQLVRRTDEGDVTVDVDLRADGASTLVTPSEPWLPDSEYHFEGASLCRHSDTPTSLTFTTGPAADPPVVLGELAASAPERGELTVASASGTCSATVTAVWVDVELTADPSASPWIAALEFQTRVDGQVWLPSESLPSSPPPGESWVGRGRDRIFAVCDSVDPGALQGLEEGLHAVELRARLPGDDGLLVSDEIEIELRCDPSGEDGGVAPDAGTDAGTPPVVDGGTPDPIEDGDPEDAGEDAPADAAASRRDAGTVGNPAEPPGEGRAGCGCAVPGEPGRSTGVPALAAWLMLFVVCRRRRLRAR